MLYGLMFLGIGVAIALATWNANRTGEMQGRFEMLEREDSPDLFRLYLCGRLGGSALMVVFGLIVLLFGGNSN